MNEKFLPQLPIVIDLKSARAALHVGIVLIAAAGFAIYLSELSFTARAIAALLLLLAGGGGLRSLRYGGSARALRRLAWLGDDHWELQDCAGRRARARLARGSRRVGRGALLIFHRGVFERRDRPWVLLLPNMVSDAASARRLRARLTIDGARMRGMDLS